MQLYGDDPTLTPIYWFWSDPAAPFLDVRTVYGSFNWYDDYWTVPTGPGPEPVKGRKWVNGKAPRTDFPPTHDCITREPLQRGALRSDPLFYVNASGLADCCWGTIQIHGLVNLGHVFSLDSTNNLHQRYKGFCSVPLALSSSWSSSSSHQCGLVLSITSSYRLQPDVVTSVALLLSVSSGAIVSPFPAGSASLLLSISSTWRVGGPVTGKVSLLLSSSSTFALGVKAAGSVSLALSITSSSLVQSVRSGLDSLALSITSIGSVATVRASQLSLALSVKSSWQVQSQVNSMLSMLLSVAAGPIPITPPPRIADDDWPEISTFEV